MSVRVVTDHATGFILLISLPSYSIEVPKQKSILAAKISWDIQITKDMQLPAPVRPTISTLSLGVGRLIVQH